MMREMAKRSLKVAVLADSSKIGRRLFARIARLSEVDYLVTEKAPPPELQKALDDAGVKVVHE